MRGRSAGLRIAGAPALAGCPWIDGVNNSGSGSGEMAIIYDGLHSLAPLGGLTAAELADIAERMRRYRFARGDVIIRQGDLGETFYLVRSGSWTVPHRLLSARGDYHGPVGPPENLGRPGDLQCARLVSRRCGEPASGQVSHRRYGRHESRPRGSGRRRAVGRARPADPEFPRALGGNPGRCIVTGTGGRPSFAASSPTSSCGARGVEA